LDLIVPPHASYTQAQDFKTADVNWREKYTRKKVDQADLNSLSSTSGYGSIINMPGTSYVQSLSNASASTSTLVPNDAVNRDVVAEPLPMEDDGSLVQVYLGKPWSVVFEWICCLVLNLENFSYEHCPM
jgi:hypothetical protein